MNDGSRDYEIQVIFEKLGNSVKYCVNEKPIETILISHALGLTIVIIGAIKILLNLV